MALAAHRHSTVRVPIGPLTYEDLQNLPDESGLRYELLDGVLLMTPSPVNYHQIAVINLTALLREVVPEGWIVMIAPFDWKVSDWTVLQPDLFVIERPEQRENRYEGVPLLAVEVLAPSTHHRDVGAKLRAYEDAGLSTYWVVDTDEPSLTVFHRRDGRLVETARVSGSQVHESSEPFSARVVPAELIQP